MNCIFCRIVAGELPCAKVFESARVMAFLDIAPVEPGHTLVIPKQHYRLYTDLPDDLLLPLGEAVRAVGRRLTDVLRADGLSVSQANGACAGQVVPHVHFHLIPRYDGAPMRWRGGKYDPPGDLESMAGKLSFKVGAEQPFSG